MRIRQIHKDNFAPPQSKEPTCESILMKILIIIVLSIISMPFIFKGWNSYRSFELKSSYETLNLKKNLPFGFEWVHTDYGTYVGFYRALLGPYEYVDPKTGVTRWTE